jgi:hypothetical protein
LVSLCALRSLTCLTSSSSSPKTIPRYAASRSRCVAAGRVGHHRPHELKVLRHHLAAGLIAFVDDLLDFSVLIFAEFQLLGHVVAKHGGRTFDLELDFPEPLHLVPVENSGEIVFGRLLELFHRLAHHLPSLGLDIIGGHLALLQCCLLLHGGIDLNLAAVDLRSITAGI